MKRVPTDRTIIWFVLEVLLLNFKGHGRGGTTVMSGVQEMSLPYCKGLITAL
jgi:hypothetical protein